MSTFSVEHSFDFDAYGFTYHHPSTSDPLAYLTVTQGSQTVLTLSLQDSSIGIRCSDGEVQFGEASFSTASEIAQLKPHPVNNTPPQFSISSLPNNRLGGIGIEDLRDAGFNRYTFQLEVEPIIIWYNSGIGFLEIEYRDPLTAEDEEEPWYQFEVIN